MNKDRAPVHKGLSRRLATLLSIVVVAAASAGCSSLRGTPQRYAEPDAIVDSIKLSADEVAALQSATTREERNLYQNKAIAVVDVRFHQFTRQLTADRADMSAGTAGATLAASTAGAFVESTAAKTNYALFAAGVVGAFGIVDKNYYYEKTVPALVAGMNAARANVLVRMRQGQAETIADYTGVMALADLEDYFTAGTILAAVAEITARAESDKQKALTEVRALSVPSDDEIARRTKLRDAIFAIDAKSLDKANKALVKLGGTEQKTDKEVRLALLRTMRPPTAKQLTAVEAALAENGLLK